MVKFKLISIIIAFIFLFSFTYGCAPRILDKVELQQVMFKPKPEYIPPMDIEKPEKPEPIFLDGDFNKTDDMEKVEYFSFNKTEFTKIIQLSQAFDVQQSIMYFYVGIINGEIDVNNDLKETLTMKDIKAQHFADLYINEQNLRLQENYQYEKEKILNKIIIIIQTGVILGLVF